MELKKTHSKAINTNIINNCSFLIKRIMERKKKMKPDDFLQILKYYVFNDVKNIYFFVDEKTTDFSLCFMGAEQQVVQVTVIHINLSLFLVMVKAFKMPQNVVLVLELLQGSTLTAIFIKVLLMASLGCFCLHEPRG